MTPQDPQTPAAGAVPVGQTPPADGLNAQIPPSYAPGAAAASPNMAPIGTTSSGSALDDALAAQLAVPEPDPMAGFANPTPPSPDTTTSAPLAPAMTQPFEAMPTTAPVNENVMPSDNVVPSADVLAPAAAAPAPAPIPTEPAIDPTTPAPAAPPAPVEPTAPVVAPPAVEAYDPSQDTGAGAPATSYPAAPAPLPPNPLEADASAALVTPPPAPTPMTEEYAAAPMPAAPEPAPVEVAMPAAVTENTAVDMVTGLPIEAAPAAPVTDPTLQSMLEDPAAVDPYSDPAALATAYPANPSSAGKVKGILIAVGIGVGVLAVGIVVLALILGRKPLSNLSADSLTAPNGSSSSSSSSSSSPVAVPDGFVTISRPCYSFGLPKENTITESTSCSIDATFGSQGLSKITVIPSTDTFKSLDEAVTAAKEIYNPTIVKEQKMSLGGLDAYRMDFTSGNDPLTTKLIVLLPNKNYKADGAKVTGMEINIASSDAFSQAARDTLMSTWSWK